MKTYVNLLSTRILPEEQKLEIPSHIFLIEYDFLEAHMKPKEDFFYLLDERSPSVFTSKYAVESIVPIFDRKKPCFKKVYCVGGNTAYSLIKLGVHPQLIALNARGLAEAIIQENKVKKVNFICGNLRRNVLIDLLTKKGIDIFEVQSYQVRLLPRRIEKKINGILFFSPSGVQSYLKKNMLHLDQIAFAIGNTTGSAIREVFSGKVLIADEPKYDSVLHKAIEYYTPKNTGKQTCET